MSDKPYSDPRWYSDPGGVDSLCEGCKYFRDFYKCDKYEQGIPRDMIDKSFPGCEGFDENYCQYRKNMEQED